MHKALHSSARLVEIVGARAGHAEVWRPDLLRQLGRELLAVLQVVHALLVVAPLQLVVQQLDLQGRPGQTGQRSVR